MRAHAFVISLFLSGFSPFAYVSAAHAATAGCDATDANCNPDDPCTFDYPLAGYDCGAQVNNATSNGTFITPAADLGFTWAIPKAWSPDSYTQIYWDCGINFSLSDYPSGCAPIISFGAARPEEFLEQMPGFGSYQPTDPLHDELWSYTFAWWVDGHADVTASELSLDFVSYYQGLMAWCESAPGVAIAGCDLNGFKARFVENDESTCDGRSFTGEVQLYDEFYTGNLITLNIVARARYCPKAKHEAVLYSASLEPRPGEAGATKESDSVWARLLAQQAAFDCE